MKLEGLGRTVLNRSIWKNYLITDSEKVNPTIHLQNPMMKDTEKVNPEMENQYQKESV
jgi:hypothetical protein|tara:strand:- start:195 stop:368 length:174 start_codon:yes stop_codon:yes gene_type:complete